MSDPAWFPTLETFLFSQNQEQISLPRAFRTIPGHMQKIFQQV